MGRVANYVLDLLDGLLREEAEREMRFPWALGDPSPKTGRCVELPFDAVWVSRRLIVEVDEDQHRGPVEFWDKPDVITVSGVSRAEQRAIYDRRKRQAAREQGSSTRTRTSLPSSRTCSAYSLPERTALEDVRRAT